MDSDFNASVKVTAATAGVTAAAAVITAAEVTSLPPDASHNTNM